MLSRSPIHTAHSRKSTLDLIASMAKDMSPIRAPEPRFRQHWKALRNSKGGFLSFEDLQREEAARKAADYGPPQGPCARFRDNTLHHSPMCFCGWSVSAHLENKP